jgi:hypothetical protein
VVVGEPNHQAGTGAFDVDLNPLAIVACGILLAVAVLLWPGGGSVVSSLSRRGVAPSHHFGPDHGAGAPGHPGEPAVRRASTAPGRVRADSSSIPVAPATSDAVADGLVLLALALRAGCDPVEALETAARQLDGMTARQLSTVAAAHRWGLDPAACWELVPAVWHPAAVAWQASLRAGVSPSALLLRSATVIRDREAQHIEAALSRAGVLLVLPLGLAFLPGFVATTVVPVVLRLVGSFLAGGAVP